AQKAADNGGPLQIVSPLGQEDFALIELQDGIPAGDPAKHLLQILLDLSNRRAQLTQFEHVERPLRLLGIDLGSKSLSYAWLPTCQDDNATMLSLDQVAE